MSQDTPEPSHLAEAQARALAASIDAAAEDLERNGPASPEEVRQALLSLEAEWEGTGTPSLEPHRKAARPAR